jgi:hypothetical protein
MVGLVFGGCGDSAEDQCKDFFEAMCSKVAECSGGDKASCVSQSAEACEGVEEVNGDPDACIDAVESMSCDDFSTGSLPDSCRGD